MRSVKYYQATSWGDAVATLAKYPLAKPLAGGSDLFGWIKDDLTGPKEPRWEVLVDLRSIEGAAAFSYSQGGGLRIGALAPLSTLEVAKEITDNYPMLARAFAAPASPNIRNVGTIAGNINQRPRCWYLRGPEFNCYKKGGDFCFAVTGMNQYHAILEGELCYIVHPSDTAPALLALDAKAKVVGPKGEKTVPLSEYFIGPRTDVTRETILAHDELMTEIQIPAPEQGVKTFYFKATNRETYDFAIVNVASWLRIKDGVVDASRIYLSGVAPTPYRATVVEETIKGKRIDEALARQAADQQMVRARPMSENAYKVDIAKSLIRRALLEAN
ncbi:MAG: xanthine dehydrogenase family protein subunit M [Dehalococcoidia bacterium]